MRGDMTDDHGPPQPDRPPPESADDVTFPPTQADTEARTHIEAHLEHYLGTSAFVIHEPAIGSDGIDVHIIPPSMLYPFYSLVTVGMSDVAMPTPPGAETFRYAEMLVALPRHWPIDSRAWKDETSYWPIRVLRALARMPYLHDAWVGPGYSVPHGGDPPRPYARNTRLCAAFVTPPMRYEPDFLAVVARPDKVVRFHAFIPLYRDELAYRHDAGPRALRMRLTERNVTERLDIKRKSVMARRWFGRR